MKTISLRTSALLLFALLASIGSLALALTSEYTFGLKPCELCILQRIPYAIIILLSLLGLVNKRWTYGLAVVIALAFLADSGIAFYHTAVEKHWIPGPEACTDAGASGPMTLEQIRAKIMNAPIVACDQPQWEFHGITMAMLNAFWALGLSIFMFVALQHKRKSGGADA